MLKNNLVYKDDYIFFTFNGIRSSNYNLMIQNNIDDLKIITNTNSSIDYASLKYQTGRYMMGVTRSHRVLSHKLVAYGLTRNEANKMAAWLQEGNYGSLVYDYAPDWKYNVVINKLGDMNLYPVDIQHFIVSFDIEFNTIEGTDAENIQDAIIILDQTTICAEQAENSDDITTYYGINNKKIVPALACYHVHKDTTDADENNYIYCDYRQSSDGQYIINEIKVPLFLHHIGDGYSVLNLSANVGTGDTECEITTELIDAAAKIKYSNNGDLSANIILDYKGRNHLFFLNNETPEIKALKSMISGLSLSYSSDSLIFSSPGALQELTTDIDEDIVSTLVTTPYSWFFYITNDTSVDYAEYYDLSDNNVQLYPNTANGTFLYDYSYINTITEADGTQASSVNTTDLYNNITDKINALGANTRIYFGYYERINIYLKPMQDATISITQFNDLLIGGI